MKQKRTINRIGEVAGSTIYFPVKLVKPVTSFLRDQLRRLEHRKKDVEGGDPFSNVDRVSDNAAPDADAEEQFGHAMTWAVREQLENKIRQTKRALRRIRRGKYGVCENCGNMIDTDRLKIYPEATLCVTCEKKKNKK